MEVRTKQRLVGGFIIFGLLVIGLPVLLDGANQEQFQVKTRIPEKPQVFSVRDKLKQNSEDAESIEQAVEDAHGKIKEIPLDQHDELDVRDQKLKTAWTVQVGSFTSRESAIALEQKLLSATYRAYRRETQTEAGDVLVRVFVGPELRKKDARSTVTELKENKEFGLSGLILTYKP